MPNILANDVVTYKHKRNFIQFGGPRPNNVLQFAGQDSQYLVMEGVGAPESGGIDPIYVPGSIPGKYKLVGRKISPADLMSASLKMLEKHGSIPRQLQRIGCAFNLYEVTGDCADLSDFLGGWTDYVLVYSLAIVTNKDLGTRSAWDTDTQIEDTLSLTLADVFPIGGLSFGEQAAPDISREVVDVVYGSKEQCGDCGPQDDGTLKISAVTKSSGSGSPGMPAEVIYTLNSGASWSEANITGLGATADPTAIDIVGNRLVVIVTSENAYYWSELSAVGIPGAWTKVTTGFVAAKQPNDLYVAGPREVYFCGNGGYIYKSTNITAGVTVLNAGSATANDLLRIHGREETIVAVGKTSTVIRSINRGATFSTVTTSPSGISTNVQAVAVLDRNRYWVGLGLGRVMYTLDGGETAWGQTPFDDSGTGQVHDIVFVNDEVGYFAHATNTPTARVYSTWNGGADWTRTSRRILNFPTFNKAGRIAVPQVDAGISANHVTIAGLAGDGTDGILLLGVAART